MKLKAERERLLIVLTSWLRCVLTSKMGLCEPACFSRGWICFCSGPKSLHPIFATGDGLVRQQHRAGHSCPPAASHRACQSQEPCLRERSMHWGGTGSFVSFEPSTNYLPLLREAVGSTSVNGNNCLITSILLPLLREAVGGSGFFGAAWGLPGQRGRTSHSTTHGRDPQSLLSFPDQADSHPGESRNGWRMAARRECRGLVVDAVTGGRGPRPAGFSTWMRGLRRRLSSWPLPLRLLWLEPRLNIGKFRKSLLWLESLEKWSLRDKIDGSLVSRFRL